METNQQPESSFDRLMASVDAYGEAVAQLGAEADTLQAQVDRTFPEIDEDDETMPRWWSESDMTEAERRDNSRLEAEEHELEARMGR